MSFAMNLANWTERFSTPAERFFLGVTMTLVGLTIVLLVLSLISLMVSAISRVVRGKHDKRGIPGEGHTPVLSPADAKPLAPDQSAVEAIPGVAAQETSVNTSGASSDAASDATLVAIFAAAISAYTVSSEPQTTAGFVIRRFRRV